MLLKIIGTVFNKPKRKVEESMTRKEMLKNIGLARGLEDDLTITLYELEESGMSDSALYAMYLEFMGV